MTNSFPTQYEPPEQCRLFFEFVSSNTQVQAKLFHSKQISEVSQLARDNGFNVTTAQILRAQAGRVICTIDDNENDNIQLLLAGKRSKTGAQWGRECEGYLDAAGYWLLEVFTHTTSITSNSTVVNFLYKCQSDTAVKTALLECLSFNDIAQLAMRHDTPIAAKEFLRYQANAVMTHSDDALVERIANGRLSTN